MFWQTFVSLCVQHNTKPNPVAEKLGISSGAVTKWKKGTVPNSTTLKLIADYFSVSVSFLTGEDNTDIVLSDDEKNIIFAYRKKTDMQEAVKKLLLDDVPAVEQYAAAAYEGNTEVKKKPKKTIVSP